MLAGDDEASDLLCLVLFILADLSFFQVVLIVLLLGCSR